MFSETELMVRVYFEVVNLMKSILKFLSSVLLTYRILYGGCLGLLFFCVKHDFFKLAME